MGFPSGVSVVPPLDAYGAEAGVAPARSFEHRFSDVVSLAFRELPVEGSHLGLMVQSHASYYWTNRQCPLRRGVRDSMAFAPGEPPRARPPRRIEGVGIEPT